MIRIDDIVSETINAEEFREILSNHFENLSDNVVLSLGINPDTKVENVVDVLRKAGINAVPYYSEKAIDRTCFVIDDTGIRSPYLSAEDSLLATRDIYNALKENGIDIRGYALPMTAQNLTKCIAPKSDRQIDVVHGNSEIERFICNQLGTVKEHPEIDLASRLENTTSLYRGGTLGNQPYAITGSRCARNVCYATPDIRIASEYADGGFSVGVGYLPVEGKKYGFIYEMATVENYKKYPVYGIENRKELAIGEEMYETPVFPHKNPLKAIYLQYGKDIIQIADNKGYFSKDWEKFAKLHEVYAQNEKNNTMISRVNNLVTDIANGEDCVVAYQRYANLENDGVYDFKRKSDREILQQFVFAQNVSDGLCVKNADLSSVNLPEAFNKVHFEGNLKLKNVSGLKGQILDLSECTGNVFLENMDLSECANLILPKQCEILCLGNVKLPKNMKSFEMEKCGNLILQSQDMSTLESIKFPEVSGKIRFWGKNVMPQAVDVSNLAEITETKEKGNLDFSKTQTLVTASKNTLWRQEEIEVVKHRLTQTPQNQSNSQSVDTQSLVFLKSHKDRCY